MALTPHGLRYAPLPRRQKTALCLSGGGFRAALFHLGAVRRLSELGTLREIDTMTAVSGGTLIAAFLAERQSVWTDPNIDSERWERSIAAPFRAFASRNLSGWPVLKGWLTGGNAGVEALADRLRDRDLSTQLLEDLPGRPDFKFCATDLISGLSYVFEKATDKRTRPDRPTSVAFASAVSACYPIFFRPYRADRPERIALVDGGVFDDRGIEPVWRDHATLLISDGGDVLRTERGGSLLWPALRSAAVIWDRYQEAQKRWLIANFESGKSRGTFWGINSSPEHYAEANGIVRLGYSPALARDVIATIRTDYDAFSAVEAAVLENHGYLMADAAMSVHASHAIRESAPLRMPHPAWMSERLVREALRDSSHKRFFGRGFFDFRGHRPEPEPPSAGSAAGPAPVPPERAAASSKIGVS